MYYDLILHNRELHICHSPVSFNEEEILELFGLQGGVFIYGSDYYDEIEQIKNDLLNESRNVTDYDDETFWSELFAKYQSALQEQEEMSNDNG